MTAWHAALADRHGDAALGDHRPICGFPHYAITKTAQVLSITHQVPARGGSTRTVPGRQLTPDCHGRVTLSRDGVGRRFSVDRLHREHWPELYRSGFPRVRLAPERLHWLEDMMRRPREPLGRIRSKATAVRITRNGVKRLFEY